jgi:hypothetical protein
VTGPEAVLAARQAGCRVYLRGDGRLCCDPPPPPEVREAIREHRAVVLDLLRAELVNVPEAGWHRLEGPGSWYEDEAGRLHWCGPC